MQNRHPRRTSRPTGCVPGRCPRDAKLFSEADLFILAQFVFLERMNIRVIKKIVKPKPGATMASPEQNVQTLERS